MYKMFHIVMFILMCDLGNEQERKGGSLTVMCLCVRWAKGQVVLASFMST